MKYIIIRSLAFFVYITSLYSIHAADYRHPDPDVEVFFEHMSARIASQNRILEVDIDSDPFLNNRYDEINVPSWQEALRSSAIIFSIAWLAISFYP